MFWVYAGLALVGLAVAAWLLLRPRGITGTWRVIGSTAVFRIYKDGAGLAIEGWDSHDGERFVITEVAWDGTWISGTFLMPSTNHRTHSRMRVQNANTLVGRRTGAVERDETWKRL